MPVNKPAGFVMNRPERGMIMRVVGRGIQEFEKIRNNNQFYVDKTSFISDWYRNNDDITLITRPRRFGKTLTIDMLYSFFSTSFADRADLFEGLTISRDERMMAMQGTVPAIKVSFSGVKGKTFDQFLIGIAGKIAEVLYQHRYLLKDSVLSEGDKKILEQMSQLSPEIPDRERENRKYVEYLHRLTKSLHFLSLWLYLTHGKKVFIFMDEYDTPIQTAWINHYYEDAIEVMRDLFSETFKDNGWMERAVITGITRIAKESLFSEMNNLVVCSMVCGGYDRAFGFTKEEMDGILEEYELTSKKALVQSWYDGFTIGEETGIYNPWSIVNYLSNRNRPPQDYWAQSGGVGLIDHLVRRGSVSLKKGFELLLGGDMIKREISEDLIFPMLDVDENAVWSLLVAAGYVRPEVGESGPASSETGLCLTNYETKLSLSKMVKAWFNTRTGNHMNAFAGALLADDLWEMNEAMQQVVLNSASSFDSGLKPSAGTVQPENFFHALTLGMLTCLSDNYRVTSNRESGFGRYDVCIEPLGTKSDVGKSSKPLFAAVLEFKVFDREKGDRTLEDTAKRARKQIDEKVYDADLLSRGIPKDAIRRYGFGFRGKEVVIVP